MALPITLIIISVVSTATAAVFAVLYFAIRKNKKELSAEQSWRFDRLSAQAKYLEEFRMFRHDYKHLLWVLQALLEKNEYEQAKEYLSEITGKFSSLCENTQSFSNNTFIDAILQNLAVFCKNENVKFEASVIVGNEIPLSNADLCTLFCNIADNAAEAVELQKNPEKFICFTTSRRAKWLIITVENSYDGIIRKENGEITTRKNDAFYHGVGLNSIKSIVEAVPGAQVKIEAVPNEHVFRISLIFPRMCIKSDTNNN